ncbi:pickpocket protein 28-like isoform X1 [Danaus plexippus]|uniref:pickpocket protein 28-like isoform X1 n=1 Tax=Danaus plexippus TaxID=13037 RepID=UPI002AAF897F|nr:pickpocket protein 28-like isoform X1 [Danaus plexippus]
MVSNIKMNNTKSVLNKQNYWTTQSTYPWYDWNTNKQTGRSKSEQKPARQLSYFESFVQDFRQYLLTSTLHGLRYVGEKKLTWFERFFWLAAFCSAIVCASFFILNVYAKWKLSPMIVSINPENIQLNKLPFPAITICNVNQAKKSVAERYKNDGGLIDKKLLESLCLSKPDADIFENELSEKADWEHTRSFLINITQPCNEMLAMCIWDSIRMSCQDLFNAQLTDEGLCCTFNVVHREKMFRNPRELNDMNITFPNPSVEWTPESGFPDDAPPDGFPWRPQGIGTDHGLTLLLDANVAEYYCSSTKTTGFKVLLHNPIETPNIAKLGEVYGPGIEVRVAIEPKILDANPSLKHIDINKRLCLFSSEKELFFYRTYSLRNCEMECEARAMLDVCKCVLYYMPKNKTTRVCGTEDAKCYSDMRKYVLNGRTHNCDECLPACTEISYTERPSSAPLNKELIKNYINSLNLATNRSPEYFISNMLIVHFYFENNSFMRFTKEEVFGLTEFLSNTGGLLGLCLGFSMMSLVELLYYLTLRALCVARKNKTVTPFVR